LLSEISSSLPGTSEGDAENRDDESTNPAHEIRSLRKRVTELEGTLTVERERLRITEARCQALERIAAVSARWRVSSR
jgi:hypothetical protein